MAGMGLTVTRTSGGQTGTLQPPKASHHLLAPHETLPGMTARKFRECHTRCPVPCVLGSWGPGHHGNGSSGQPPAQAGKQLVVESSGHMVLSLV